MELLKRPYEISLWRDDLVFVGKSGTLYADIKEADEEIVTQYYKETKICVIGSNTMDSPARCTNPKFTQKINGENTLFFSMYYQYIDPITGKKTYNPFNKYLTNERKVKLRVGPEVDNEDDTSCQWYDLIIKNIQENSETKVFTYTCKDQFVNELSKSGFDIELDNELENNMGIIDELANTVLEGSDWILGDVDELKQYKEEPIYKVDITDVATVDMKFTAKNIEDDKDTLNIRGKTIYVFYSDVNEKKDQWQFLYIPDGESKFKTDDDLVIDKSYPNYVIDVTYGSDDYPIIVAKNGELQPMVELSYNYRGNRLIRQFQTQYDSVIDKYVGVYLKNGEEYYGYTESDYISSGAIINYAANPSNFTNTTGWQTDANKLDYTVEIYPKGVLEAGQIYQSFLTFTNKPNALVMNAGIGGNRSSIGSFEKDKKYIIRIKYKINSMSGGYATTKPNSVRICEYEYDTNSKYVVKKTYFDFSQMSSVPSTNDIDSEGNYTSVANYVYLEAKCKESLSKALLTDWDTKIGLFFSFGNNTNTYYIEDVQVFPYETYVDENNTTRLCVPSGKLNSEIKTKYIYYKKNNDWKDITDFSPEYSEYEDCKNENGKLVYIQQYRPGASQFTKVRSISGKESNRFNLIQELCETFECWPKFTINRNQKTGEIKLDKNYRQEKFLSFKEYVGQSNPIGFKYGINSKSIQRTIDSAAIVSKMIVKDNANEFAPNGFCSIARATENPSGENFLLNFDHYVRNRLLNFNDVTNDLYLDQNGYLGYYKKLKRINADRDKQIDIQSGLLVDISRYDSAYTTYKTSYDSAIEEQLNIVVNTGKYIDNSNITNDNFVTIVTFLLQNQEYKDDSKLNSYFNQWCQCENIITQHKPLYEKAEKNLTAAKEQYEAITQNLKTKTDEKRELAIKFYKKYSRFLQEGSWIKEDYTDPNLYYLDAESTLHASAQPKVTYNISVIDIAPLAEQEYYKDFKHYTFKLGDKTYIEDIEFFGWSLIDGTTPYKEEVVVSEITTELDTSEKNQIKVQNYKTQFEDLFQRITATTQQAEYHTGEYERAAGIVEADGKISISTLENSFANNSLKLSNARDQSVVWDETGITTTCLTRPSEMVRIVSGGIFLSNDGGQTWKTGVTGSGINTSYLTAGQINTNEIYIMNGNNAAFRWDEKGLAAYYKQGEYYNPYKFVRFDHNGIYGILAEDEWTGQDADIHDSASFALTWSGFSLKNKDGSVRISTDHDIQVLQDSIERIKIGRLDGTDNPDYGIRIKDATGATVMETDAGGQLWLRDKLSIGTENTSSVEIGYLSNTRTGTEKHEVIRAGDSNNRDDAPFIVYEDGRVIANYIEANGGRIGNMTIEQVENSSYEVVITSNKGISLLEGTSVELIAHLYKGGEEITTGLNYRWYDKDGTTLGTNRTYEISSIDFNDNGYIQYGCEITVG